MWKNNELKLLNIYEIINVKCCFFVGFLNKIILFFLNIILSIFRKTEPFFLEKTGEKKYIKKEEKQKN